MNECTCVECGRAFKAELRRRLCSDECRKARHAARERKRYALDPDAGRQRIAQARAIASHPCATCGTRQTNRDLCSRCAAIVGSLAAVKVRPPAQPRKPRKPTPKVPREVLEEQWRSTRSSLRAGYEDGDAAVFFAALRTRCHVTPDGCWEWTGRLSTSKRGGGYPCINWAGKNVLIHRASLEMKHGAPLGSQSAHHACANTTCVNPEHLQPVTHRENIAEMKARQAYVARIRELEAALTELQPSHPLLAIITVA